MIKILETTSQLTQIEIQLVELALMTTTVDAPLKNK